MKRNGNIEAFRCLAMLLIVIYHMTLGQHHIEMDGTTPGVPAWELLFTVLTFWHVDAFVAISGWFGIKFSWFKFFKLWGMIWFYALVGVAARALGGGHIVPNDFYVTGGWFGGTYLALLLISPFLNAGLDAIAAKGAKVAWSVWALSAAAITLNWIPFHLFSCVGVSGFGSHCIATLIFVYSTARLVRLTGVAEKVRRRHILAAVMFLFISVAFWGICKNSFQLFRGNPFEWGRFYWQTSYDAPHIWIMAIAMLIFFDKFANLSPWMQRVSVIVGPSVFAVYLTHESALMKRFVVSPFLNVFRIYLPEPAVMVVIGIVVFSVGILVDFIRRGFLTILLRIANRAKRSIAGRKS